MVFIYFRAIKELKVLSITLFGCIIIMTLALIILVGKEGTNNNP